jgi:sialic acid synthase SpsE
MAASRYAKTLKGEAPYLIAEIGSNHGGQYMRARRLVIHAAASGADAVKFQLFTLRTLIQPETFEKALAIKSAAWRQDFKKLEFPLAWLPRLKRLADKLTVDFLCTPFNEASLAAYTAVLPPAVKIASGDITHHALLGKIAASGLPALLSTGASAKAEIKDALAILGKNNTALLDCVMRYPASEAEYSPERLTLLQSLSRLYGVSDHSMGSLLAADAVSSGALVVEKHFTLDRQWKGADNAMSADPAALKALKAIMLEAFALRTGGRIPARDSRERIYARRAIYAGTAIQAGEVFTENNCIALRPAVESYIPASSWQRLLGRNARQNYTEGEGIALLELENLHVGSRTRVRI